MAWRMWLRSKNRLATKKEQARIIEADLNLKKPKTKKVATPKK